MIAEIDLFRKLLLRSWSSFCFKKKVRRESSHFLDLMYQSLRQNVRMHNANDINSPLSRRSLSSGMSSTSTSNARSRTTAKECRKKCYKKMYYE